jgi:hypothetical protein
VTSVAKAAKTGTHWRRVIALTLFAGLMLAALALANSGRAAIETPPPPSVWSDKADYAPGEQVTLSGANWAPGESVHIRVNDDAGQTWNRDVDVTAGSDGTISDQFNLPDWFVAQYSVTATGASSGTATWTFTDGNATSVSGTVTDSTTSSAISGATVTCTSGCNNSPAASTTTNASGNYLFDNTTTKLSFGGSGPATLVLTVSKTGYTSGTITLSNVSNGDTLSGKNIALTPACTAPSVTTQPTNQTVTYGANATFSAAASGTAPVGVQWQVSTDSGAHWTNLAGETNATLTLTAPTVSMSGNQYRAVFTNACGSASSNAATLTVNKADQTITINTDAPATAVFNTSFTVAASASSGLPVSYSASGVCSHVGATFTMTSGTGTCTVHYNQAGNDNYNAAPEKTQDVTAAKADQSITFAALASKTLGDPPFTVSASGGGSGNPVTFSASPSTTCTSGGTNGATITITGIGTCTVTADQAGNGNYNAAPSVPRTFAVSYNFTGFFAPVDNNDICNIAKAGSAIPVKFTLHGYQGMSIFAAGYPKATAGTCSASNSDAIEETSTASQSGLNYDASADQYIYVWKTDKAWAGKAILLTVRLADGSDHTARFSFTR